MANEFQQNPFWDFSLAFYGKPGVADACVYLQDKYGLDVNIILFCVWVGSTGRGPLDANEIGVCVSRTSDWRGRVIEPLRQIRRACRDQPLGVPEFLLQVFHPLMRDIELDAEHVEQLVLAELGRDKPPEAAADAVKAFDAQRSLLGYVAVSGQERESQLDECVLTILRAAFPGVEISGLD